MSTGYRSAPPELPRVAASAPSVVIGACLGLAAFALAIVAGLMAGNEAERVLARALVSLAACAPAGFVIGLVCEHVGAAPERAAEAARSAPGEAPSAAQPTGPKKKVVHAT